MRTKRASIGDEASVIDGAVTHEVAEIERLHLLSPREREILSMAAGGYLDKEIGAELSLSLNTLRTYWTRIRTKLGSHTRTALVAAFVNEQFKDAGLAERVRSMGVQDALAIGDPTGSLSTGQVPDSSTPFIGREREIAAITNLLCSKRLVSLTSIGGNGKTRLAMKVAELAAPAYPDGVWFVEIGSMLEGDSVARVVSTAIGQNTEAASASNADVAKFLKNKLILLVLDGCERAIRSCMQFCHEVLGHCPNATMLATSREKLGVPGEEVYQVRPLACPPSASSAKARSIQSYDAVQMFVDRARASTPGFYLSDENAAAVASICRRIEGIPLAIELAASSLHDTPLEALRVNIEGRLLDMPHENASAPGSPETVRDMIEWSYANLSDDERILFSRLSIFDSGWTAESAAKVCGFNPLREDAVLTLLAGLFDKSLVAIDEHLHAPRYSFLVANREFAAARLARSPELGELQRNFIEFYVSLATDAGEGIASERQPVWFERLSKERGNIQLALTLSAEDGRSSDLGLAICAGLWRFWGVNVIAEGRNRCMTALAHSEGPGRPDLTAKVEFAAAQLAFSQSDLDEAERLVTSSIALFRQQGDMRGEADGLNCLAALSFERRDEANAFSYVNRALQINRHLGNVVGEIRNLNNLGFFTNVFRPGSGEATAYFEQALAKSREAGQRQLESVALASLGDAALDAGEYAQAERLTKQAAEIARAAGDKRNEAFAVSGLGYAALLRGEGFLAQVLFRRVLEASHESTGKQTEIRCIEGLSGCEFMAGRIHRAATLWGGAAAMRESLNTPIQFNYARQRHQRDMEDVRQALGEKAFSAAIAAGRQKSLDELLEYAQTGSDLSLPKMF